jgi:glycosyltransferase involved in cell wall biosynthesis
MDNVTKQRSSPPPIKLGVFFSHPTQHHSVSFQHLSRKPGLMTKVYYYDPGQYGRMYDPGYRTEHVWDIDVLAGTDYTMLRNPLRGRHVHPLRQFNPGIPAILHRERFDAVFLSGYVSPSNRLVLWSAKALGAHVLYQSDTNILDEVRKAPSWVRSIVRGTFLRHVDTFLVIGDNNRKAYLRFGCDPSRMVWCPCPVDIRRFEEARLDPDRSARQAALRRQYDIPPEALVVAFCGKLTPRKRPQDLIAALRRLGRQNVFGLIIGSGEMEDGLRASLTPSDRVRITGFVNQSAIPYHMMLADVGVVCSERDPHPLVTTEFAAVGLPLLVSNYCGVWGSHDILRPGENGFVYDCGDISQLATRLASLIDDPPLRARFSSRSVELAQEQAADHAADVIMSRLQATVGAIREETGSGSDAPSLSAEPRTSLS